MRCLKKIFSVFVVSGILMAAVSAGAVTIGFANLTETRDFPIALRIGLQKAADARGWTLIALDNRLDAQQAVKNTQQFIQQKVDCVLMFNVSGEVRPIIADMLKKANIPAIAIDLPLPGIPIFGVNNPVAGRMTGEALASYAKDTWKREPDLFVLQSAPESSNVVQIRLQGIIDGFLSVFPDFPEDNIVRPDTYPGGPVDAEMAMNEVLASHPDAEYIAVSGYNESVITGAVTALEKAGRGEHAAAVSLGADRAFLEHMQARKGQSIRKAAVASGPELYGDKIMALIEQVLNGETIPDRNYVSHFVITPENLADYYPEYAW